MSDESELPSELVQRLVSLDERLRQDTAQAANLGGASADSIEQVLWQLEHRWPTQPAIANVEQGPLLGNYRLGRELGRGGFGVVFLAKDERDQRAVAVKIPRSEVLLRSDVRQRFLREAQAMTALTHPHIVPVLEVGSVGPVDFIVSQYCPGGSLADWLQRTPRSLSVAQAARVIEQLADAMAMVHRQGMLHRDLKPANVLLGELPPGTEDMAELPFVPLLTDFGLAKLVEQSLEETGSSMLLGTPLYMAPELADCRHEDVGPWTDVYGLGAILYELLTGRPPFTGRGLVTVLNRVRKEPVALPRSRNPEIPRDLERICLHCLEKDPRDRYQAAEELADDLRRHAQGQRIRAKGPHVGRRLWRLCTQPERMRDAGVLTILLNIGIILWMVGMTVGLHLVPEWRYVATGQFTLQVSLVVLLLHFPQLALGWYTFKQRRWAIYIGFAFSLVQLSIAVGALTSSEQPFDAMYTSAVTKFNSFWLLTQLFSAESLAYMIAILADWHRPKQDSDSRPVTMAS